MMKTRYELSQKRQGSRRRSAGHCLPAIGVSLHLLRKRKMLTLMVISLQKTLKIFSSPSMTMMKTARSKTIPRKQRGPAQKALSKPHTSHHKDSKEVINVDESPEEKLGILFNLILLKRINNSSDLTTECLTKEWTSLIYGFFKPHPQILCTC